MNVNFDNPMNLEDCILYALGQGSDAKVCSQLVSHTKYYKLIVITGGECIVYCADTPVKVKRGEVYLAFPFDVLDIKSNHSDFEYKYIGFSINSQKFGNAFNRIWSDNIASVNRAFHNEEVPEIVDSIFTETDNKPSAFSKELVSLLCSQMLVHIVRCFDGMSDAATEENSGNAGLCGIVMNYIDAHLYDMKSLADMASKLGYNYSYLSTTFHKTTHTTLNSYYKTKRMDAARILLAESKMTISKIAELMNYSSVYAFSKAFKEHFGVSPGHYSGRYDNKDV